MLGWDRDDSLAKYTTAPNTRSLSVTSDPLKSNVTMLSNANRTGIRSLLLYENANTSVGALLETEARPRDNGTSVEWIDKSTALKNLMSSDRIGTPFTSDLYSDSDSLFEVSIVFTVGSTTRSLGPSDYSPFLTGYYEDWSLSDVPFFPGGHQQSPDSSFRAKITLIRTTRFRKPFGSPFISSVRHRSDSLILVSPLDQRNETNCLPVWVREP